MKRKCIAIFEDDEDILQVTMKVLSKEYEKVEGFLRCDDFIKDIERTKPDLILLDLRMPGINCEQVLILLRKSEKTANIPVIIFSALEDIGNIAKRVNATAILEKPFSIDTLRKTVAKYIS